MIIVIHVKSHVKSTHMVYDPFMIHLDDLPMYVTYTMDGIFHMVSQSSASTAKASARQAP